jgi:CheY-like chemotaxis protein
MENALREEKFVLVVDDEPSIWESLSELPDARGYSALQAENGQKRWTYWTKMPRLPCLVVLDLAMPVMDGRAFLKVRALDPVLREIPVVVVSGNM